METNWKYVKCTRYVNFSNEGIVLSNHTFFEIIFCIRGNLHYTIEGKIFPLTIGDILLIPPGNTHIPVLEETLTEPFDRIHLYIDNNFFEFLSETWPVFFEYKAFLSQPKIIHTINTNYSILSKYFEFSGNKSSLPDAFSEPYIFGNMLCLFSELLSTHTFENTAPKESGNSLIEQVLAYIRSHLTEKITIENTARNFNMNQSSFSKFFRNELNISFYRFVTQQRLIVAKELIAQGNKLSIISPQAGFKDYSNFYRAFIREYGISPHEYQKSLKL